MQIFPLRFCQVQKGAFCGLQNTPKFVFGRGSAPDPSGGAHDAPPDLLIGWKGDTPPHNSLGIDPPWALRIPTRSTPV